eukprot:scaffold21265_cov131-Isochrysis_galbana.AAC.13
MYSRFDDEQKNPAPDAEDLWNVPACKLPLGYGLYAPGSPASVAAGEPVRGVLERKADEGLAWEHANEGTSGPSVAPTMTTGLCGSRTFQVPASWPAVPAEPGDVQRPPGPVALRVMGCRACVGRSMRAAANAAACARSEEGATCGNAPPGVIRPAKL